MLKLMLAAAALTALPLLLLRALSLPALPAPVEVFDVRGQVLVLESIRIA